MWFVVRVMIFAVLFVMSLALMVISHNVLLGLLAGAISVYYLAVFVLRVGQRDTLSRLNGGILRAQRYDNVEVADMLEKIKDCYLLCQSNQEMLERYEEGSSTRKVFDLIWGKMQANALSAVKYVEHYDFRFTTGLETRGHLKDLRDSSVKLSNQLISLKELLFKVEDTTREEDMAYVDDMLSSLREVIDTL